MAAFIFDLMTIKLVQAAQFYRNLKHQDIAWDYLYKYSSIAILSEFYRRYGGSPLNLKAAIGAFNNSNKQIKALEFLQVYTSEVVLENFAARYRSKPIVGFPKSTPLQKILERLNELNISLFDGGTKYKFGTTVLAIQGCTTDFKAVPNTLDEWNDVAIVLKNTKFEVTMVGPYLATCDPGRYYTKDRLLNPLGAARVKPDVKHNAIWEVGWHKDQKNCLVQTGGKVTVIRDTNKNGITDGYETAQFNFFGINFHHTKGNYNPQSIGRWSAGCLVLPNVQQHQALVEAAKSSGQRKFSYVLLTNEFLK